MQVFYLFKLNEPNYKVSQNPNSIKYYKRTEVEFENP